MMRSLGLALAVLALAIACTPGADTANVSISLGRNAQQALSLGGITIAHFQLDITCVDGRHDTVRGDVDENGNFSADVSRCPQATVRFSGLTQTGSPALLGTITALIEPPSTELTFDTIRVGTMTFQNDAGYASVCEVTTPEDPTLSTRFALEIDGATTLVLPVVNTTLVCIPQSACADIGTCILDAGATQVRTVAVPWGDVGTLQLQNLTNTLAFLLAPTTQAIAGAVWPRFTVQLLDDSGSPIDRSDITVKLAPSSSIANGGFISGGSVLLAHGLATFDTAAFATAGALTVTATANVNGVLLSTDVASVSILADVAAALHMSGPATIQAGQSLVVTVTASDRFNNPAALPPIDLSSTDPQTFPIRLGQTLAGAALTTTQTSDSGFTGDSGFALYTAGPVVVTATDALDAAITATLAIDVIGGPAATLLLSSDASVYVQDAVALFTIEVTDQWNNPTESPGLTAQLYMDDVPQVGTAYTFSTGDGGVGTINFALSTAGSHSFSVGGGSYVSNSVGIQVNPPNTTASFQVVPQGSNPLAAGAPAGVTVTALDAAAQVNTSDNSAFEVYFSDPQLAAIPATFAGGHASVMFSWKTAGQQTITINGELFAVSPPVTVQPTTAQGVRVVWQPPVDVRVGNTFSIAAIVADVYGNAVDPTTYGPSGFSVTLVGGTGQLNAVPAPSFRGSTVFFDGLSFNSGVASAQLSVQAGGLPGQPSQQFVVSVPGSCATAYVTPSGVGDGCSLANPTNSINAALAALDSSDGTVNIAAGEYPEQLTLIGRRVLLGGYDATFVSGRNPLQNRTIIDPPGVAYAIDVTTGASSTDVVLDGLVILASDLDGTGTPFAAGRVTNGASLRVERCIVSGPYGSTDGEGGVWDVVNPTLAVFQSNWIATGGLQDASPSASPRHGIRSLSGGGVVSVVSNTFIMAANAGGAAVELAGSGDWSLTDNLIIGDFSSCGSGGMCALADGGGGAIGSAINNVIVGTPQSVPSPIYLSSAGPLLDPNQHPGNFRGNQATFQSSPPDALLLSLNGPDGFVYTMEDNDWHVSSFGSFTIGIIDTGVGCGAGGQAFCGGDGKDIDGDLYTTAVGADEP